MFGEGENHQIWSITALKALGLQVDPVSKQLKPAELSLL